MREKKNDIADCSGINELKAEWGSAQTCTESALMISPLSRFASSSASLLFPEPVGPEITMTFCFFSPRTGLETEHVVVNARRGGNVREEKELLLLVEGG